jgi:hypothetical protein
MLEGREGRSLKSQSISPLSEWPLLLLLSQRMTRLLSIQNKKRAGF